MLKPFVIGDLVAKKPIIQGGMGVGISLSSLAGAVAKEGGIGIISTAQIGFREPDFKEHPQEANLRAIGQEIAKARAIAPLGIIGVNIMVATRNYALYVKEAIRAGVDLIISGAGLPVSLPEFAAGAKVKLAPIVSSAKSAMVICKMWDRKYHRIPDFVVIEGPLAGGHLGFSMEQLEEIGAGSENREETYRQEDYDAEVKAVIAVVREYEEKYDRKIPIVTAGGIYSHEDVLHQFALGADAVQVGTRFVTTEECDAPMAYKQAYLNAHQEDIVLTKSPVGMPGRAIRNSFLREVAKAPIKPAHCYQCLERCDHVTIPYCITQALVNAALGDEDHALIFCGSNAYRAEKIETVKDVIEDLTNTGR
ncbi:MAG: nitronate monooxygenase family protein [Hungatella sp.]